jgi:hypothetical protein
MQITEDLAKKILLEKKGYTEVLKVHFSVAMKYKIQRPYFDFIAFKDGKRFNIEVKSWDGASYRLQPVQFSPKRIHKIMIICMSLNMYTMLNPRDYYLEDVGNYIIKPRSLTRWQDIGELSN